MSNAEIVFLIYNDRRTKVPVENSKSNDGQKSVAFEGSNNRLVGMHWFKIPLLLPYKSGVDKDLVSTSRIQANNIGEKRNIPDDPEVEQQKKDFFKKPRLNKSDNTTKELSEDESEVSCNLTNFSTNNTKRKKCALIIDDAKIIRKVFVRALTGMGFAVKQAENGLKGMLEMKSVMFDVVFCDFLMPLLDGLDCVQQYRDWEKANRPWFKQVRTVVKDE